MQDFNPQLLPAAPQRYAFRFSGQAGEYFRIWIVNLALSILTLGIYSAWAKVRSARYFYSHTSLDDSPFEYLAQPLAILRGRIVGVAVMGLYGLASNASPLWFGLFMLALMLATPFLLVMAMRFRLRMSSWRGVRFGFDGCYPEAAQKYLAWPLLLVPTLGLGLPYVQYKQSAFLVERSRFGDTAFRHGFRPGQFYAVYLKGIGLAVLGFAAAGALVAAAGVAVAGLGLPKQLVGVAIGAVTMLLMMPVYLAMFCYFSVRLQNLLWNHVQLGEHRFESRLSVRKLCWLHFSNTLATLATLGLAYPWAKIRMLRYRAACITLLAAGSLETFQQGARSAGGATGEQVGEFMDLDLGL